MRTALLALALALCLAAAAAGRPAKAGKSGADILPDPNDGYSGESRSMAGALRRRQAGPPVLCSLPPHATAAASPTC